MEKKYYKNLITSTLIISFSLMPLSAVPKKAQGQGLGAYTQGLIPAIAQLPLCRGKLTGATKYLFGQASEGAALDAGLDQIEARMKAFGEESIAKKKLASAQAEAAAKFDKIGVYDEEANKKIDELKAQLAEVKRSTASLDANDTCLKNIGRLVIKMLLQKLTLSTVNWINSGFDGQPAYVQDPGRFFEDIAKNEILQFGLEIDNPELFPFGKIWMQNQARAFNNKFTDNARYSLDEMIRSTTPQFSAISFQEDFSQGGWGAWSAMTQYPQNNPLGFQLMASDELQRRLEGTQQSVAQNVRDALQEADGFLGDQRCIEAETGKVNLNITRSQYDAALREKPPRRLCSSWEYVTPGQLIAQAATSTIKYPENNLLKAEDLNDAFAAVADALLQHYTNKWMTEGFAKLGGEEGADGTFIYNPDVIRADYSSQTEKDFAPVHLTNSWLASNPNFNIRTGLTQALIDEQRTYSDKLTLQNKELNSTTDGKDYKMGTNGLSNAYGLIPAVNQLDYCIPGPHPGWEEDSRRVLDAVTNQIVPETEESIKNQTEEQIKGAAKVVVSMGATAAGAYIGGTLGSAVPIVGTAVGAIVGAAVGFVAGFLVDALGGPGNDEKLRMYYSFQIRAITGIQTRYNEREHHNANALMSKQASVQAMNEVLERYIKIIHKVYSPKILPSVYREATREFSKLQGYAQIIENNTEAISDTKNVINTLGEIKSKVEELNARFPEGGDEYENELKAQINAFGRLSASMVNGDDIASADNLLKQIVDEINYIYKDLLKGPLGCEKDLQEGKQNMPTQLYQTKRMNYPFPILYTYDMGAGAEIPDPFSSISELTIPNKTNTQATGILGPGFLSFYAFQRLPEDLLCDKVVVGENGAVPYCFLELWDILPVWGSTGIRRSLGITPNQNTSSAFENSILVY